MSTVKHWERNREEYLDKAMAAIRANGEAELGEIVDEWERLTGGADRRNLWKALQEINLNADLNIEEEGSRKFISVEESPLIEEMEPLEDQDFSYTRDQMITEVEELGWLEGESSYPVIPTFVFQEHSQRHGYDYQLIETENIEGITASDTTQEGDKKSRFTLLNKYDKERDRITYRQSFRSPEMESLEFNPEELFTGRNRESFVEKRWTNELATLISRAERIRTAAVMAVEFDLEEIFENYSENDRYSGKPENEFEALKWDLKFAAEEEFDEQAENYIEGAVENFLSEDPRGASIYEPFMKQVETTPTHEGDMPYSSTGGESETAEGRTERYRVWMEHYLDLVWQLAEEKYA